MKEMYKEALDTEVSKRTKVDQRVVAKVTGALYDVLTEQMVTIGEAHIPRLGRLRAVVTKFGAYVRLTTGNFRRGERMEERSYYVDRKVRLYFTKSLQLTKAMRGGSNDGQVRS